MHVNLKRERCALCIEYIHYQVFNLTARCWAYWRGYTLSFILSCHTSRHASLEATGWRHCLESDWMRLVEYAKGWKNGSDTADMRSKLFLSSRCLFLHVLQATSDRNNCLGLCLCSYVYRSGTHMNVKQVYIWFLRCMWKIVKDSANRCDKGFHLQ